MFRVCAVLAVITGLLPRVLAQPAVPAAAVAGGHEMTAQDIETFLDGLVPFDLQREDIAGAVVSIVKDGQLLFAKGYGYADLSKKTPVSPDNTLFRPGSISKLFVWTSIMQLQEQGKLDLDRDVNQYLDFSIPSPFHKPLTLRNIMTHTSGFEETVKGLFVMEAGSVQSLDAFVKQHLPHQIFPPGTLPAYSNYATALAGYIVQRVSNEPFEQYVENHIFKPLGMTHCTFRQPLPAELAPLMSSGYQLASGGAKPFEFVNAVPAGSSSVSALDMSKFMLAHLGAGSYNGVQILKPETATLMHSRQFGLNPAMNGMALGFYEESQNGHRIIGHGGDSVYFHSDLHLVPDANLGFFVSYNSAGKGEISPRSALWKAFLDRYLPFTGVTGPAIGSAKADAQSVAGPYMTTRRSETTVLSVLSPLSEQSVSVNPDDTISMEGSKGLNGAIKKFREVAPLLFQHVNGQSKLAFQKDSSGQMLAVPDFPAVAFQRAGGLRSKNEAIAIVGGSLVLMILTLLLWPVGALVRWHYGRKLEMLVGAKALRFLTRMTCLIDLLCVAMLCYIVWKGLNNIAQFDKLDWPLRIVQLLGIMGGIGAVIAVLNALVMLFQRTWWGGKLAAFVIAAACCAFTWFIWYWHLLNPSLNY